MAVDCFYFSNSNFIYGTNLEVERVVC